MKKVQILLMLLLVFGVVFYLFYLITKEKVLKTSRRIQAINILNSESVFYSDVKTEYHYSFNLDSKQKLETINPSAFLVGFYLENSVFFNNEIGKLTHNKDEVAQYDASIRRISEPIQLDEYVSYNTNIPYVFYKFVENIQFRNRQLRPITDSRTILTFNYTSPKGRNSYTRQYIADLSAMQNALGLSNKNMAYSYSKDYQRSLLTSSMRYNILRRDGFKCQICGRKQEDGVKLHVDHIIPVSRGGKSVPSNLRTLCEDCNIGKGAKYENDADRYANDDRVVHIVSHGTKPLNGSALFNSKGGKEAPYKDSVSIAFIATICSLLALFALTLVPIKSNTSPAAVYETTVASTIQTETVPPEPSSLQTVEPETIPYEDEYIFPYADVKLLTEEDVEGMTREEIQLAINEIYAREGREFKGANGEYFKTKSWYNPMFSKDEFSDSLFNEIELKNIEFLVKHQ